MNWRTALTACVVTDRHRYGRILATGKDFPDLLNRLSTNAVGDLAAGSGAVTVVTSPKGRIVQRLFVHHRANGDMLCTTGPGRVPGTLEHFRRFTFAEETGLSDVTRDRSQIAVIGPLARDVLVSAGLPAPPPLGWAAGELAGLPVEVLGQDGVSDEGVSVLSDADARDAVWGALTEAARSVGGGPADDAILEAWRIARGHGEDGAEFNLEHNPLEAGLMDAVSFDKGCYVGQEVVARLRTYDKVARRLVGWRKPAATEAPAVSTELFHDGRVVGGVTSAVVPPGEESAFGLAYVRKDFASAGTRMRLADPASPDEVEVVDLPMKIT